MKLSAPEFTRQLVITVALTARSLLASAAMHNEGATKKHNRVKLTVSRDINDAF